ncbi:GATA-domain-containing protein [Rhizodiscina lignyota]|uniref:GATA-domain-containing protein n=1 Tax=Rhizodiscina lignyota TaxID=1504668 RepID=A0A9P4M9D5_9PEZI|nr:GATA-domain-containing protein [Rhizodiscina lignyota]
MLARSQQLQDSLIRIKEVVLAQNASATEQAAQDQRYKVQNGYQPEEHNPYQDDTKSAGFAGADPKKRRGRAAPPGRCHSCNRAETPEWRRGPDGARTLCNACGLHYAKLTRKMGTNKAAVGGSNLRPKGPGSPIA